MVKGDTLESNLRNLRDTESKKFQMIPGLGTEAHSY